MSVERGTYQNEKEREEPMPIISPEDRQTLQTLFAQELQDDVNITYFSQRESVLIVPGQECSSCKETRELLEELTDTSDKLHLTVKDFVRDEQEAQALGITRIPAFILQGHARRGALLRHTCWLRILHADRRHHRYLERDYKTQRENTRNARTTR